MRWMLVLMALLVSSVYVLISNQKRLITEGDMLLINGKPLMAISMYERALLNYLPFSPYNQKAIERIEKVCNSLLEKSHKLFCYETLRSSLYQLRGISVPYSEKIKPLEEKMLLTKMELYIEHNNPPQKDYQKIFKDLKSFTQYDPYPSTFWSLLVVLSLAGWVLSLSFAIIKGFKKAFLFAYVVFFCLWLVSLYMA
ncbi:conserved hypothetical protein [Hydrogenobacter thermophilus TK-6]|uniref:Uncharacterized protein n=1 Tax=Hydrogenobacter thermophilus (strain DSM 6534 / IAM 12695 / TK-6) TaxID=608538 RepID=D3DJV1_HYDTT|nr:hypothetical protein [Hydrogenobacter thermophilus]ADO46025.1 conserved hypothetical protein [Hydrogenobacter thermophilus TK-6]BAI70103.1 hypothetical protein HTH_1656 [Hydrogenobacter thermophilus TK-6]